MGVKDGHTVANTEQWEHKNYPAIRVAKPKPKRKPPAKTKKVNDGN